MDQDFKAFLFKKGITEVKYNGGSLDAQAKLVETIEKSKQVEAGPWVGEIFGNLKKGKVGEAFYISSVLFPFETGAAVLGTLGATFTLYQKLFVPWRHHRAPYNLSQLSWRNELGAAITIPAVKRTYLVIVMASWVGDKWRKRAGWG